MRRAFAISLLIHSLPILIMLLFTGGSSGSGDQRQTNRKPGGAEETGKIIPKPSKQEPVEVEIVQADGISTKKKPQVPHEKEKCTKFFGGIGIQMMGIDRGLVVLDAVSGYPAANAGIKPWDLITSPKANDIKGEVGTEVEVVYTAIDGSGEHKVTLVRDKICTEKNQ